MKTKILILTILFTISASFKSGNENNKPAEFNVVKDVSGIKISTRWIPVTDTRSARQVKCEFLIDGSLSDALSVLYDDFNVVRWMKGSKQYYRVKTSDQSHWYSYVQFHVPWPFNNQDCIIKYDVSRDDVNKRVLVNINGVPAFLKTFEGVNRIPHMEGHWLFSENGSNKVMVEYVMFSNQSPRFPRWITDPIIQKNMLETMDAFRSVAHARMQKNLAENENK